MRLSALALALATSLAAVPVRADDLAAADPGADQVVAAYAPIIPVAVMLETGQALLWDETASEYKLGRVGDVIAGWKIVAIEATKIVVMNGSERDELPLEAAPVPLEPPVKAPRKLPTTVVTAEEPAPAAPAAPAAAPPPEPAPTPAPEPAPTRAVEEKRSLTRAELDSELGDFDRLLATIDVKANDGGGFVLTRVAEGSWVYRMGLRSGDVVRAVAGEQVSTIEDAARVYARLRTLKKFTIELDRGGKRVLIHYDVKK